MSELPKPTDAELEILSVLWMHGPSTVRQVHEQLDRDPPRGYTTILKLMQIMCEKGLVRRDDTQRAHIYEAAITREDARGTLLGHLMDRAFDKSAGKLIMQALATRPASAEELAEIRRMLDRLEGDSNESDR
jgi:predicted transcriptional regulator